MATTKRKLRAAEARRLAVLAECDPRTIIRVLATGQVPNLSSERAARVLEAEGLIPPLSAAERAP